MISGLHSFLQQLHISHYLLTFYSLKQFKAWIKGKPKNKLFIRDIFGLEHENQTKFGTQRDLIVLNILRTLCVLSDQVTCHVQEYSNYLTNSQLI